MVRPRALTIPLVTVEDRPSGAPSATTGWPTSSVFESPIVTAGRPVSSTLITAMSVSASRPTSVAAAALPSLNSTLSVPPLAAGAITWLLVRMYPSDLMTSPDPVPAPPAPLALMVTTEGSTSLATCVTWHTAALGWLPPVLVLCPVTGVVAAVFVVDAGELIALAITPPITPPTTAQAAQAAIRTVLGLFQIPGRPVPRPSSGAGAFCDVIPTSPFGTVTLRR